MNVSKLEKIYKENKKDDEEETLSSKKSELPFVTLPQIKKRKLEEKEIHPKCVLCMLPSSESENLPFVISDFYKYVSQQLKTSDTSHLYISITQYFNNFCVKSDLEQPSNTRLGLKPVTNDQVKDHFSDTQHLPSNEVFALNERIEYLLASLQQMEKSCLWRQNTDGTIIPDDKNYVTYQKILDIYLKCSELRRSISDKKKKK